MLAPGSRLGRYEIVDEVGRGAMAAVYRAFQPALDRHVAIKVLPDFFASDPVARQRFQVEAQAIARLRHPSILSVFDYGEDDGVAYIVTELVEGGTMAAQLGHGHSVEAKAPAPCARSPTRSTTRTGRASSTATSSRPTSSSVRTGGLS